MEIFTLAGLLAAAFLCRRDLASLGVTGGGLFDLALAALVGGAIGARLFYLIPHGVEEAGSGFYGALTGGMLGIAAMSRLKRWPALGILDAGAARLPVGFAMGKVGCFLAGCCYGMRCGVPPGVSFAQGSLAYREQVDGGVIDAGSLSALPVHPTQLYELAFALALFGALVLYRRRPRRPGSVLLLCLSCYSLWRFVIEWLRDDPGRRGFGVPGLTDSQTAALVVLACSVIAWIVIRKRPLREDSPS